MAGFVPQLSIVETEKKGKTFVNIKIQVGDFHVKFDPEHWAQVRIVGDALEEEALNRRDAGVDEIAYKNDDQ